MAWQHDEGHGIQIPWPLFLFVLADAVSRLAGAGAGFWHFARQTILHEVGIFQGIFVVVLDDLGRDEAQGFQEELRYQVTLA